MGRTAPTKGSYPDSVACTIISLQNFMVHPAFWKYELRLPLGKAIRGFSEEGLSKLTDAVIWK